MKTNVLYKIITRSLQDLYKIITRPLQDHYKTFTRSLQEDKIFTRSFHFLIFKNIYLSQNQPQKKCLLFKYLWLEPIICQHNFEHNRHSSIMAA